MAKAKSSVLLSPAQLEEVAALFKVLGEPMRLKILQTVCKQPRSVNEIVEATGATQANVSKHLSLLTTAGILRREKDGQRVYYSVREPFVVHLCELVRSEWVE
jgi:DNA-binding transcriptional ArsR family regulator